MNWQVSPVRTDEVRQLWASVAPMLVPAIRYSGGRIDARSVVEWLMDGRYILWIAHTEDLQPRAALVTRVANYPRRSMLAVDLCGGSGLEEWAAEADRVFREYSRHLGLSGIELAGRIAWTRALKKLGWQQFSALVSTDV